MWDYSGLTLVIPDKPDFERDSVGAAWTAQGGEVLRLGRFWEPPALDPACVRVYGNETFCLVLADLLKLELMSPADDLIRSVPTNHLRRRVAILSLGEVLDSAFPVFVKPITPKQFSAGVYTSLDELKRETRGLPQDTAVIQSEVVRLEAEARAFLLEDEVLTVSVYQGNAPAPWEYVRELAHDVSLPPACVLDTGLVSGAGWAFLEANAAWGAGLNGCEASLVLPCIERASRPAA